MEYIKFRRTSLVCVSLTLAALLVLSYTSSSQNEKFNSTRDSTIITAHQIRLLPTKNCDICHDVSDPSDTMFYNIISEEEALSFKPCADAKLAASAQYSSLSLIGRKNGIYNIGEEICVIVTLYNGYGKIINTGGDQLRATIENEQLQAYAPCVVTDNRDGTHYVKCETFWSGRSLINVTLAYTRQTVTAHYRMRKQVLSTRYISGLFKRRSIQEAVVCHPNHTELLKYINYTELCNMTYINSGMSFYCGKPRNRKLLCEDWQQAHTKQPYPDLHLTACDDTLLMRGQIRLNKTLYVEVSTGNTITSKAIVDKPTIPCSQYNRTALWQSRIPTGYFYQGKWILRNCIGFQQSQYKKCLKGRHLYLIGDSTIRGWYPLVMKRFECRSITEWGSGKWQQMGECYNKELNFKAGWYPPAQPFYLGFAWDDVRYTLHSVSRRLDNISDNERAIIVVHVYAHFISFHQTVFRDRLEIIRRSIERLLARNKHSIVMIKAPHTFTNSPIFAVRMCDYFGFVYSKIMYEVFDGVFDRVVLLNNKDYTTARHEIWNHPPGDINSGFFF